MIRRASSVDSRIIVLRLFSRLNIGGPAIHVLLATAGLNPALFKSLLVVGRESPNEGNMLDLANAYDVQPIQLAYFGRRVSPLNDVRTAFALCRLIRQIRPHIVHTHTAKAGVTGRLAAWLMGVPVIVHTFHGQVFDGYFGSVVSRLIVLIERWLARPTSVIIAISPRLKDELLAKRIAPHNKVAVIELGLDLEDFLATTGRSGVIRADLPISAEDPLVGIVGRLVPIKDHRTFLEACVRVIRKDRRVRFVIVGDGELRGMLEALSKQLGLADRVYFTGWKKHGPSIYADLDLVVVSSRNEGTPVSIIEALATGKPVVATRVGGVPDLVEHGSDGLLVPPADPQALADAIIYFLENPEAARAAALHGRERVRERYSKARLLADLQTLYLELLKGKGICPATSANPAECSSERV
jgi:glycosyltransferase involved in cell wall biosynthesis